MTSSQVRLTIDSGDFKSGFSVGLQCFDHNQQLSLAARGILPAQPSLEKQYLRWKDAYMKWGGASRLDPVTDEPTNVSFFEQVQEAAKTLEVTMHQWLESATFQSLRQILYGELSPHEPTILIIQTRYLSILRLPWLCWRLFEAFPLTQVVLAPESYRTIPIQSPKTPDQQVKLLAVMAGGASVDTQGDRLALENLPSTKLVMLDAPTRKGITDLLWTAAWDIFFFAGHSSSQTGQGQFKIAQENWSAPSDMKFALQSAARQGLKLAIFNSCDGLAIAQELVQNDIPFIITMREPVPDEVAHAFLGYFLMAYSHGKSLFQAFQEARTRLEALEDQCPCATWLPVLMCNPAVAPPAWRDFYSQPFPLAATTKLGFQPHRSIVQQGLTRTRALILMSIVLLIVFIRSFGLLQGIELWAFDQLMQLRPQEIEDSRLLIVEIDEATLQSQTARQGSISDQQLSQVIQVLNQSRPRVIGLDIYRDHPNLGASLQALFQNQHNIIGVCKSPDPGRDEIGVAAPKGLSNQNTGFSDILEDTDGVVRRQLLFMGVSPTNTCATPWSFSSKLALRYLSQDKISHDFSDHLDPRDQYLIVGKRAFHPIRHFWGGYQRTNLGGNQIMLNYRAVPDLGKIAPTVGINDVLNNKVSASQIRERIVIIGVTANTTADFLETPYHSQDNHRIPGVFLQAHMVSQLISAVQNERPLIYVWPRWGELLWIISWGIVGRWLPKQTLLKWAGLGLISLSLVGLSLVALILGLWIPIVPSVLALWIVGLSQNYAFRQSQQSRTQQGATERLYNSQQKH